MTKLTESAIEEHAIALLQQLGYTYIYAPDIAHDGENPERENYSEVILTGRLEAALERINPKLKPELLQTALDKY